jgi:hypothetical protein
MPSTPTLIEIAPGLFRVRKDAPEPPKSDLPMPNVISDTMPATEQVDGKLYESKSAFSALLSQPHRSWAILRSSGSKALPKPAKPRSAAADRTVVAGLGGAAGPKGMRPHSNARGQGGWFANIRGSMAVQIRR